MQIADFLNIKQLNKLKEEHGFIRKGEPKPREREEKETKEEA